MSDEKFLKSISENGDISIRISLYDAPNVTVSTAARGFEMIDKIECHSGELITRILKSIEWHISEIPKEQEKILIKNNL